MIMNTINAISNIEIELLPLCPRSELKSRTPYQMTRLYKMNTKYGEKVMVDLDGKMSAFLPGGMVTFFQKYLNELEEMQEATENQDLLLIYLGTHLNKVKFAHVNELDEYSHDSKDSEAPDTSEDSKNSQEKNAPSTKKLKIHPSDSDSSEQPPPSKKRHQAA